MVSSDEHIAWLTSTLINPCRQILIAEVDGTPVGTIRIDFHAEYCELSWTIAPESRRKGFGKLMVTRLARELDCSLRVEIKEGNIASVKIAQAAGMKMNDIKDGVMYWQTLDRKK